MKLEWLAAVLRPEDIAPHPNFPEPNYDRRPTSTLAAVVLGDPRRSDDMDELFPTGQASEDGPTAHALVRGAVLSLSSESIREGISELSEFAHNPENDLAAATAATLLAVCALSELEQHHDAVQLLTDMLARVEDEPGAAPNTLLRLALLLQLCLRKMDWAQDIRGEIEECRGLLQRLANNPRCPDFEVSPGATGSSTDTVRHIVEALRFSHFSFQAGWSSSVNGPNSANEYLRTNRSEVLLLIEQDAARQYARNTSAQFEAAFSDPSIRIGRSSPDLFYVNLRTELLGSRTSLAARRELALFRLVNGRAHGVSTDYAECSRLLRYSANCDNELDLALKALRQAGPLAALSHEVRQVLLRRLTTEHVRYAELSVLTAGAELLTDSEASSALNKVFGLVNAGCPFNVPGRWTAYSRRLQHTWRAAVGLAKNSGRIDELAARLLTDLSGSESDDETIDLAYARTVHSIDWSEIDAEVTIAWELWLDNQLNQWPHTADTLRVKFGRRVGRWDQERELTLSTVGDVINDALRGHPLPLGFVEKATVTVIESMAQLSDASNRGGPFGMGGVEPAECAAALIHLGAETVWLPLTDFLTNVRVPRSYRSAGFDLLVDLGVRPPVELLQRFTFKSAELLSAPDTMPMGGDHIIPYPSAMRFLGRSEALNQRDLISAVMRLAGASELQPRVEAARSLAVLASSNPLPWMVTTTIQLSHDQNGEILGYCANALAILLRENDELYGAASTRLIELMASDGMIAPLLALRGLRSGLERSEPTVKAEIERLAVQHPSRQVRVEAAGLLSKY